MDTVETRLAGGEGPPGRMPVGERRARREEALRLLLVGVTDGEVARAVGLSEGYVASIRRAGGVQAVGRSLAFSGYPVIAELCNTDRPLAEIAAERGVTARAVSHIFRQCLACGIPVRPRPPGRPPGAACPTPGEEV